MFAVAVRWTSVFTVILLLCAIGFAQQSTGSARLAGTVLDPGGSPIQNATVVVKNDAGLSRTIQTDEAGRFSADGLPPGGYSVDVSANGFAPGGIAGQQVPDG